MRKLSILLALLTLLISVSADAGIREVKGTATGRYYNEIWKSWSEEPISVYIDEKGGTYIKGGEGLIFARVFLYVEERIKFIELLKKGLKWAETAKKEKVEITKELGSFMNSGSYDQYGVKLTFFALNKGHQTDTILYMVDYNNMFNEITLYLNPTQVKSLIKLLEKVPHTLKELKEFEKKSNMFE